MQWIRRAAVAVGTSLAMGIACGAPRTQGPGPLHGFETDTLLMRVYTRFLADDLLAGRATGTDGAEIAARYIRSACRQLGLSPVGGSYLHPVPAAEAVISDGSQLVVTASPNEAIFRYPDEFTPYVGNTAWLTDFEGPAVLVGTDSAILASDPNEPDLRDAVALTLGSITPEASRLLASRGARGMVSLVPDGGASLTSRRPRILLTDASARSSIFPSLPSVLAGPEAAQAIAELSGTAANRGSRDLGLTLRLDIDFTPRPVPAHNVACLLPATSSPDHGEAIVFTAHYDHLGVGSPDARRDSVYNGFSDNAAGVAMLLAISDAMNRSGRARSRPVLLLFFVGEESGLLGSDYYVTDPSWPLDRMDAVINLDAGAPPARPWSWRIAGGESSALGLLAVDVAMEQGWSATTSAARANSDYFPFWREGVPAIFIVPGEGPYEGLPVDRSNALRKKWDRYHQPGDEWAEDFPFEGLGRYADYALRVARALERRETLPRTPGSPRAR